MFWAYIVCKCDGTYLQVRSLSSSWRSLQYSSVCLQEHWQVAGSCTNKRFFLSAQWSQHGSQTLDRERWGGKRREADYHCVLWPSTERSPLGHPFYKLQFALPSHCLASCIAYDRWVALHTSSQSRQIFKQWNERPACPPSLIGALTNASNVLDMHWAKLWSVSCNTERHIRFELCFNYSS